MKERPILFSGAMVLAILSGRKTQTRRIMCPQPSSEFLPVVGDYNRTLIDKRTGEMFPSKRLYFGASDDREDYVFKHGRWWDRLWVRESLKRSEDGLWGQYAADGAWVVSQPPYAPLRQCWHSRTDKSLSKSNRPSVPAIYMPRWASRITLEITGVRVERLQSISKQDAIAEGIESVPGMYGQSLWRHYGAQCNPGYLRPAESYRTLWESINGADSWKLNPWVWVIEFRRVTS